MSKDMKDIYEKYCNSIYRYLLLLTKDEQLSEELTQETFYQAIKSINKFSGKCSIYTWLCSIAKNCFKNYVKKNQKYVYYDNIEIISNDPTFEVSGLYNAINKLESPYKEIVQLHIYDEIPLKEEDRSLPIEKVTHTLSALPFDKWRNKEDKTEY